MDLTIDVIREWLVENKDTKEVKAFFSEITPEAPELTVDMVRPFLETADGKALLQPIADKRVTDAVKTYKENHYDKDVKSAVAAEILKLNPQETPEQKQIRELREEVEKEKEARQRDNLRRQIVEEAAREQIPSWWVDDFSGNTIEEAKLFMGKVKSFKEELETAAKNEVLSAGFKPGSGNGATKKKDLSKLSFEELVALETAGELDEQITTQ